MLEIYDAAAREVGHGSLCLPDAPTQTLVGRSGAAWRPSLFRLRSWCNHGMPGVYWPFRKGTKSERTNGEEPNSVGTCHHPFSDGCFGL